MARRSELLGRAVAMLLLLLSAAVRPAAVHAAARSPAVVIMGGDSGYPPYQFLDTNGKASGFDVELLKAIAKESGFAVKFQLGDWSKTLDALKTGKVDVVPMFISPQRRKIYDFSDPYIVRYHLIFSRKGAPYIKDLQQLAGKEVIVQRAGLASDALTQLGIKVIPVLTNEEPQAVRLLAAGAHDYALVPAFIGRYAIKEYGLQDVVVSGPPVLTQQYAFAVTKGNKSLLNILNAGLARLKSSGDFDQIYADWLANLEPPHVIREHLLKWFLAIAAALLAFISALLVFSQRMRTRLRLQATALKDEWNRRVQAEKRANFLAYNDVLTELPNRNKFAGDLDEEVNLASARDQHLGVVCVRLVNLAQINDLGGYHVGDDLLRQVGRQLSELFGDCSSALAPGLFAVRLTNLRSVEQAKIESQSLMDKLRRVRDVQGVSLEPNFRSGLAVYPEHGKSAMDLMRNAELALHVAHERDLGFVAYSTDYEPDPRDLHLLAGLPAALRQSELVLYCQPKLELKTGKIRGGEILVRWQHPRFDLLTPNVFVPLAEKSGYIRKITLHIIGRVTEYVQANYPTGDYPRFSVNISARDLSAPDFAGEANKLTGAYAHRQIFEITETAAMYDTRAALHTAAVLRENGIRLSIDDFGTGYSSLSYLRQLDPDEIKIDQAFVRNMLKSRNDRIVVESTIHLAHDLDIAVVAEGAEDIDTIMALKDLGCDLVQGYGIAKPMPIDTFADWSADVDSGGFIALSA